MSEKKKPTSKDAFYDSDLGVTRIIHREENSCELCGKKGELRPYGLNGERICFECGMKDEKTTGKMFEKHTQGYNTVVISDE